MMSKQGLQVDQTGNHNVFFLSYFLLPEAVFFAEIYLPSENSSVVEVEMWRVQLGKVNEKAGHSLADPKFYANLFSDYEASLQAQQMLTGDWKEIMVC